MSAQPYIPSQLKTVFRIALIGWTLIAGGLTLLSIASDHNPIMLGMNGTMFLSGVFIVITSHWRFKVERIQFMDTEGATYDADLIVPKPSTSNYGYVYIIQDVSHTGQYKIGRAINPNKRLNHFAVKLPILTKVVHIIPCEDYIKAESMLHEVFADVRGYGEWFTLSDLQIKLLKSIKKL